MDQPQVSRGMFNLEGISGVLELAENRLYILAVSLTKVSQLREEGCI